MLVIVFYNLLQAAAGTWEDDEMQCVCNVCCCLRLRMRFRHKNIVYFCLAALCYMSLR